MKLFKILKFKILALSALILVFLFSILNIGKLNLILIALNQTKSGWNTYPPISALDNQKLQESLNLDPKLIFFEVAIVIFIGYLSIDIHRKISNSKNHN